MQYPPVTLQTFAVVDSHYYIRFSIRLPHSADTLGKSTVAELKLS